MNREEILHPVVLEMLSAADSIFKKHGAEFYLVGATARDLILSKDKSHTTKRATRDVDIAIMISSEEEFQVLKAALLAEGNFKADEKEAIKLRYKGNIEVDLLPFGGIENEFREVKIEQPKLIINVPGFKELLPSVERIEVNGTVINVCPLEGIIILKLFAYSDRPDRTKDIADIEHFISIYFDMNFEEICNSYYEVINLYQDAGNDLESLVSQRVIGRKIKRMLSGSSDLLEKVEEILEVKSPWITTWPEILMGIRD